MSSMQPNSPVFRPAAPADWAAIETLLTDAGLAEARGIGKLYLLTTTAAPFFARRGFTEDAHGAVPAALHASREFQGACPPRRR